MGRESQVILRAKLFNIIYLMMEALRDSSSVQVAFPGREGASNS
jgi:hypothetical protein